MSDPGMRGAAARADDGDPLVGTRLAGRYEILEKLGEGAMGTVYLGRHLRIGRREAIKVLRPGLAGDAEAMARFERGARNVSSIHHPNICTVYDFGDAEDGRRFLSMEYVPGERLQDLLEREAPLPAARAVAIAAQVADALQAAHDAGIVHRDLKPANVMVSPARGGGDAVKVVDFDIAKGSAEGGAPDVTRLGFVIGTPEYMSPEQLLGLPLDGSSDVYALALVLFEMLAGTLPGRGRDTQQRLLQRLAGAPPRLDDVAPSHGAPPALQQALDRALQPRPEDRFPSAAAFTRAITDAAAGSNAAPAAPHLPASNRPASNPPAPNPPASNPLASNLPGSTPPAPSDRRDTRDGVPPTVVAANRPAPETNAPTARPRPAWLAGGLVAAMMAAAAGAWAVSGGLRPPPGPEGGAVQETAMEGAAGAAPSPSPSIDEVRTDTARGRDPGVAETRREEEGATPEAPPTGAGDPRPRRETPPIAPAPEPAPPPAPAVESAAAVLDGLEDRVGPPYPAEGELRRVRDAAREIWERGAPGERARAAFVLAHAELGLDDADACVRWAERAAALRPGGARQLLLDECRRVRG